MRTDQRKGRVAILGCGYVGSALGEALVLAGHDVVGTTTTPGRPEALRELGIKPQLLEIADVARLRTVLGDRDAVYMTIAPRRSGEHYRDVYPVAARSLLVGVRDTPVRRIIYTSSTRVYGRNDGGWVDESSSTGPADENGRILLEAEETLFAGARQLVCSHPTDREVAFRNPRGLKFAAPRGLKPAAREDGERVCVTIVRLSGICGPGRDLPTLVRGRAGTRRRDGDAYVNLIHRDDIVAALVALLHTRHHGVLNLSSDQPMTRRELYDRILAEANLPPIRWGRCDGAPNLGKRVRNDLIKRVLNITLKHPAH